MATWPLISVANGRANATSQGAIGERINRSVFDTATGIQLDEVLIRLKGYGLVQNPGFLASNTTVRGLWEKYFVVEIFASEVYAKQGLSPDKKGFYWTWIPKSSSNRYSGSWTRYNSSFTIFISPPSQQAVVAKEEITLNEGVGDDIPGYTVPILVYGSSTKSILVTTAGVTVFAYLGAKESETMANIKNALRESLTKKGISYLDIKLILDNYKFTARPPSTSTPPKDDSGGGNGTGAGTGGGGGGGDSNPHVAYGTVKEPVIHQITIKRFGRSYAQPQVLSSTDTDNAKPQMIQYLAGRPVRSQSDLDVGTLVNELTTDFLGNKEVAYSTLKFVFPYIPNDIQYSSLSSSWTEIPRANSYPFLDWSAFQRMKVSFSFLIAGKRLENKSTSRAVLVPDGMDASIDNELTILRLMFQSKQPITMYNMDSLLTNAPTALADRPTQFLMTDLTIEAVRRKGTAPLEITTAQVNITLLETIVEEAGIINITRPVFDEITPTTTTTTTTNNRPDLLSPTLTKRVTNSLVVP